MIRSVNAIAAVAVLCACTVAAQAGIIPNGGFEAGNFTNWTRVGFGNGDALAKVVGTTSGITPAEGQYQARLNNQGTLTHSGVATTVGHEYEVSFDFVHNKAAAGADFNLQLNGVDVFSISAADMATLKTHLPQSFSFFASSAVTQIGFSWSQIGVSDAFFLDAVGIQGVPEPVTSVLFGLGALGAAAGVFSRNRRRKLVTA